MRCHDPTPGTLLHAPLSLRTVIERMDRCDDCGDTMLHLRTMLDFTAVEITSACEGIRTNCRDLWSLGC